MQPLIIAFQLLTRIPLPFHVEHTARNHGYSILFYPLVGAVIGGLLLLSGQLITEQSVPVQASLLLLLWVGLTGGLHLDGLADTVDGWVGGMGSRERTLEIMKDPVSGPMGVTAIVLVLLLKWSALTALIESGQLSWLLWVPLLARSVLITLFQTTNYLRKEGMGETLAQNMPQKWAIMLQLAILFAVLSAGVAWSILLLFLSAFMLFRWAVVARLGGITGDIAGAMVEKMEMILLLLLVLMS